MLRRPLETSERGLGARHLSITDDALRALVAGADGDARRALSLLETVADLVGIARRRKRFPPAHIAELAAGTRARFDKGGDQFYDQISALHKAVRGNDPDAALYWFARMIEGGCDPAYLARRITRMSVEDIGLADPRALPMALEAWEAYERMGRPEGELALAQCVVFLAVAAKEQCRLQGLRRGARRTSRNSVRWKCRPDFAMPRPG